VLLVILSVLEHIEKSIKNSYDREKALIIYKYTVYSQNGLSDEGLTHYHQFCKEERELLKTIEKLKTE